MKRVAAIGLGNCDLIYTGLENMPNEGEEIYSKNFGMHLGGGGAATSITLSRLNIPTILETFLGTDTFSSFIEGEIKNSGIEYKNLYYGKRIPVTISSIFNTKTDRTIVSYLDEFKVSDEIKSTIISDLEKADIIIMHQGFLDIYEKIDRTNKVMVFDTSWGDSMTLDHFEPYFKMADYCTLNEKEAFAITNTNNIEDAFKVLERYLSTPIIKLGGDGCVFKQNGQMKKVPVLSGINPVDYTGAGDAFLAGFIYGIYHQKSLEQSIIYGNVTGGLSVQKIGCIEYYITEEELLEKAESIKI